MYFFATSESVNHNQYVGLGNSSTNALRNTIVVGSKCLANTLVFSIRELSNAIPYTAILYINGVASSFSAVIPNGSTSYSIVSSGNVQLNQFDLISIYLSYNGGGALSNGMCATLLTTPN